MTHLAWFVLVLAACKKTPHHEGPLRVSLGDCADATVWVSGPRPAPPDQKQPDQRVATGEQKPADKPKVGEPGGFDDSNIYGGLLGSEELELRGGGTAGRPSPVPTIAVGQPNVKGDLDKAIIRRYIKRNIAKIQYCYEKELLTKPNLKGTLQVQFMIKPEGTVAASSATGFDATVGGCVAGVIQSIEFPKPKGGGAVQVTYPFTFRPAEGASIGPTQPAAIAAVEPPPDPTPTPAPEVRTYVPYTPGEGNSLRASLPGLEACLRGNEKAYGVATIKPGTTTVHGLSEAAATCVGELAVKLPAAKTCSIAFGAMPVAELPAVEITADAIKFEGAQVADPRKLGDLAFKIEGLFERAEIAVKRDRAVTSPVSIVGPWLVRAPDSTPIATIGKVVSTLLAAGGDYVFAVADGARWRTVPALDLPIVPMPLGAGRQWASGKLTGGVSDSEAVQLSVLVQKDQIWVGVSRINEFMLVQGQDWAKFETTLVEQRKTAFFAGRHDLEVAGEGVTYGDVIKAIEIAHRVGFAEARFVDPIGLSARPTL